jgi:hypothetical protein
MFDLLVSFVCLIICLVSLVFDSLVSSPFSRFDLLVWGRCKHIFLAHIVAVGSSLGQIGIDSPANDDYRKKTSSLMGSDRLLRLQAIGFEFRMDDGKKSWEERFEQLAEFRRTHGHINIPLPKKRIMLQGVEGTKDEEEKASSTIIRN